MPALKAQSCLKVFMLHLRCFWLLGISLTAFDKMLPNVFAIRTWVIDSGKKNCAFLCVLHKQADGDYLPVVCLDNLFISLSVCPFVGLSVGHSLMCWSA